LPIAPPASQHIDRDRVEGGTDVKIVQEGIPAVIPVDACYLAWEDSLGLLAKLVEPEITEDIAA